MAVLKRVCEETPRPIREINPEIPDWLVRDHRASCTPRSPEERFQSATEVAGELAKLMASGVAYTPRERVRKKWWGKRTPGADAAPLARKSPSWSLVLPILAGVFVILAATILYIQTDRGQFVIENRRSGHRLPDHQGRRHAQRQEEQSAVRPQGCEA